MIGARGVQIYPAFVFLKVRGVQIYPVSAVIGVMGAQIEFTAFLS